MEEMQENMGGGEEMVTITVPKSVADAFMNVAETFMPVIKEAMGVAEETPEGMEEEPMEEPAEESLMMKPKAKDNSMEMEALKKRVMAGEQLRG